MYKVINNKRFLEIDGEFEEVDLYVRFNDVKNLTNLNNGIY
jgi:hypothetical protein